MTSQVRYAVTLNGLDIGSTFRYIHKYNYGGKPREKVVTIYKMNRIHHFTDGSRGHKVHIQGLNKPKGSTYYDGVSYTVGIDTQGEVIDN